MSRDKPRVGSKRSASCCSHSRKPSLRLRHLHFQVQMVESARRHRPYRCHRRLPLLDPKLRRALVASGYGSPDSMTNHSGKSPSHCSPASTHQHRRFDLHALLHESQWPGVHQSPRPTLRLRMVGNYLDSQARPQSGSYLELCYMTKLSLRELAQRLPQQDQRCRPRPRSDGPASSNGTNSECQPDRRRGSPH